MSDKMREAAQAALDYILTNGNERDMAPVVDMLQAALSQAEPQQVIRNLYLPHPLMISSGEFWRCDHGHTGLDGKGGTVECDLCRAALPAPQQEPQPVAVVRRSPNGAIAMWQPNGEPLDLSQMVGMTLYTPAPDWNAAVEAVLDEIAICRRSIVHGTDWARGAKETLTVLESRVRALRKGEAQHDR